MRKFRFSIDGFDVTDSAESYPAIAFKRFARACTTLFEHKFYPLANSADLVHWRRRDFNKQADHIANLTLGTQQGQHYCDKEVMRDAKNARDNF